MIGDPWRYLGQHGPPQQPVLKRGFTFPRPIGTAAEPLHVVVLSLCSTLTFSDGQVLRLLHDLGSSWLFSLPSCSCFRRDTPYLPHPLTQNTAIVLLLPPSPSTRLPDRSLPLFGVTR